MSEVDLQRMASGRLGRVLRGKYQLEQVLGVGGMAVVYAATHRNKARFAIKMLHPELSGHEETRTRFIREGYLANSVGHPGVVRVLDDDIDEDGSAFIVMELLEGSTIDEVGERCGKRVPLELAVSIADALLEVLTAAHSKGIVHRDLKPANLFLTNDGQLRVLDFGIARLRDGSSGTSTQTGVALGTPGFMAPEQALGETEKVDAQTDLWAVGATMFTLLTGELVHTGNNAQQLLINAATQTPRSIFDVAPELPRPIGEVIDKALVVKKSDRWARAQQMQGALRDAWFKASGESVHALPRAESSSEIDRTAARRSEPGTLGRPTISPRSDAFSGVDSTVKTRSPDPQVSPPGRRSRRTWMAGALVALGALGGGVAAYRSATGPHLHYCLDIEYTRDGPQCRFEVGPEIVGKRLGLISRVTERRGRVTKVEHLNFSGAVDDQDLGLEKGDGWVGSVPSCFLPRDIPFAHMEVLRNPQGAVEQLIKYDSFGVNLEWQKWSEDGGRIDFVDIDGASPRHVGAYSADIGGKPQLSSWGGRFTSLRVDYDSQGRRVRVVYLGPTGRPRSDNRGSYGVAYQYGRNPGVPIRETNLGAGGTPAPETDGVVSLTRVDSALPWGDLSFFGSDDHPIAPDGIHTWRLVHDAYELTGKSSYGLNGEPVIWLAGGYHELQQVWDSARRVAQWVSLGEKGQSELVLGCYSRRRTLDERGRLVLEECLDAHGNAMGGPEGYASERHAYDEQCRLRAVEYLDARGSLTESEFGCARVEMVNDALGRQVQRRQFDERDHLVRTSTSGAITRFIYDERGLVRSRAEFDSDDHPTAAPWGTASLRLSYDQRRNPVEVDAFDAEGKPAAIREGQATARVTFDENDDDVAVSYFDTRGLPILSSSTYATRRRSQDERGLIVEESYFDVHGDPIALMQGFASVKRRWDVNGDLEQEAYFGKRGEPVLQTDGFAIQQISYDPQRRATEVRLRDTAGMPAPGVGGWSIERFTYDDRGLKTRIDHLDAHAKPVLDTDGRASVVMEYDAQGNPTREVSLDRSGSPANASSGYTSRRLSYNDRQQITDESLFGPDGGSIRGKDGWALQRVRYDEKGDVVEEAFFDVDHSPVVPQGSSFSSMRQRFDEGSHLIESAYFDARGAPARGPEGAAVVRYKVDHYGRVIETRYLDGTDTPAPSSEGKRVVLSTYDGVGHLIEERFVDAGGAPQSALDGCSGHRSRYDFVGRKVEELCLDGQGAPVRSSDGWAIRRLIYDAQGGVVETATFGPDGMPAADRDGVARRKNRFDDRHLLVETTLFDAKGLVARDRRGAHSIYVSYDDSGRKTGEVLFDEKGRELAAAAVRPQRP